MPTPTPSVSTFTPGVFAPASNFKDRCANPRSGVNPSTGARWPDIQGTTTDENNWLRSWSNDIYLWYSEIQDADPSKYSTPTYFDLMKTMATTSTGVPRDKFHFTYDTNTWLAFSQGGPTAGYGATFTLINSSPPREVVVAYTEPNTPATSLSVQLARGATILKVDGVDVVNGSDTATLNAGLFPAASGETHTFTILDLGASTSRDISMTSTDITETPVEDVKVLDLGGQPVGYMVFNDHIKTAERELIDAISQFKSAGVVDLILDLRYNGGGYLDIANELSYMIAGSTASGQTFEQLQFNDKHPNVDPFTGQALTPTLFHTTAVGFTSNVQSGSPLPTLNLSRVFVITGPDTCSASESIINSLRGIGVEVDEIGTDTCGKPYGFYPVDNCGTTYFTIQFRGINAAGFGDYTDGFSPQNATGQGSVPLPGCAVADDYTHALGDTTESRLAATIQYRADGSCPTASARRSLTESGVSPLAAVDGHTVKPLWLQNRILYTP
ncbi:MAG TPA: S41 family peptidase [Pseudomonadales bacterium]|nr:S41 family peptidase [Pseudomonadales bacterium]